MDVQSVLLGFLMRKSMTGYDLKKAFSLSFFFFSGLSYGSIYPALRKMEKLGLISKKMEIQDGAPNRKVYSITEAGKEVFLNSLRSPLVLEQPKSAFLMKLFFFAHLSPEERRSIALNYLNAIENVHRQLELLHPEIKERADQFQYTCFEFGLRVYRDLAGNLREVVQALESEESQDSE